MPIYEFYCKNCDTEKDLYTKKVEDIKKIKCPECGKNMEKQITNPSTFLRSNSVLKPNVKDFDYHYYNDKNFTKDKRTKLREKRKLKEKIKGI